MPSVQASTIRRLTATLFVAQGLALAALIAATAVSSITGTALGGGEWAAGLPSSFSLIGGALAAYPAGRLMNRAGRRIGLSAGYLSGILGGLISGLGVIVKALPVFLIGMTLLGAARSVSDQARYAAADVSPAHLRARAVSMIVFAGTIGAILGPVLSPIAGRAAVGLGYDELAGPWFVTSGLLVITLIFINLLLHPDPRDVARAIRRDDASDRKPESSTPARSFWQVMSIPSARLALVSLGLAQTVMVMVMTITPVHMTHHHHALTDISFVISAHITGMYGLSMVTGWLADRWGRRAAIGVGSLLLIAACVIAPQNPDTLPLAASLFLLGLGWNMCFVAGSSLLSDVVTAREGARIQGAADLVVNLASAIGSLGSGLLIASLGFGTMSTVGAGLAVIVIAAAIRSQRVLPIKSMEPAQ
jgi:MFS family permease